MERLVADFRALEELSRRSELISVIAVDPGELPSTYRVMLHLRCVSQVGSDDRPLWGTRFMLDVELPRGYPLADAPRCRLAPGSAPVFHPQFTPLRRVRGSGGEWVDYRRYDPQESAASLVLRIARSLRYEPGYVREDPREVGNRTALQWFLRWKDAPDRLFPTDHSPLPDSDEYVLRRRPAVQPVPRYPDGVRKTFIIQPGRQGSGLVPGEGATAAPPAGKRFEVEDAKPPYTPLSAERPPFDTVPGLNSDFQGQAEVRHEVYVRFSAMRDIFEHIGWGRDTEDNRNEQGGLLLGRLHTDPERGVTYGVVVHAISGETALGTQITLLVGHDTWKTMLDRADEIMDAHDGVEILGWYHTHPNHLDLFMSGADRRTQERVFGGRWQCALVLNPHRQRWKVFIGTEARECPGFVFRGVDLAATLSYPPPRHEEGQGGLGCGPAPMIEPGSAQALGAAPSRGREIWAALAALWRALRRHSLLGK
ncbi:MAG TPA: hypothetical protein VGB24_01265 [Longimicrobium sp.]|jgi:hypothetical protein|uniref:hypothetical protein n=1 Tax=Longimicrobium sp. TaxID=2029185 RepID=UPI002ED9D6F8